MIYEPLFKLEKTGVQMRYYTDKGQYNPTHWHSAIELIYILNGTGRYDQRGRTSGSSGGICADRTPIRCMKCGVFGLP